MLKAADTLAAAGYRVRVVSALHTDWATDADPRLAANKPWRWTVVDYRRKPARVAWLRTGARFKAAQVIARVTGASHCPLPIVWRAYSRAHSELLRAAVSEPTDLFYGGSSGALTATARAAGALGVAYALDLEDFHTAEQDESATARLSHALAHHVQQAILGKAAFLTAGSEAISEAYMQQYGLRPLTLNNAFSLPLTAPDLTPSPGTGLRVVWLSQTVGPGRGIEDAILAMGMHNIPGELHLRGLPVQPYVNSLIDLAAEKAPLLRVSHFPPDPSRSPMDICNGYDVGLATEDGHVLNRALCLTNKVFTYLLAGLALAASDTPGQRPVASSIGDSLIYRPGDTATLAAGLRHWATDKTALARAKIAAWNAAKLRWNWDHPLEKGVMLDAVARTLHP